MPIQQAKMTLEDAKKKRKSKSPTGKPKKKRKISKAASDKPPEDYAAQFAQDLAVLQAEEKMPNSRLKEIYESLTSRLLRLDGSAAAQAAAADVTRAVVTSQDGRQLWRVLSTSSTGGQAQAALRLLAACVTAGPAPARALLADFQFSHGRLPQVASVKNLTSDTDVRTAFVTFVLSFLIGGDGLLIQAILDKVTPLTIVLSGLNTDRASTIHLVLSTFKQALLENPKVAKKNKIRIFNARHLGPVVQLYRWRGHQLTWRSRTNKYKKKKKPTEEEDEATPNPADPEELQQVRLNAHEFLLTLCTSHAHGIVFKDASLGTSGTNCNPVLLELLRSVQKPWRDQLKADLVVATLAACPDLCQHYWPPLASQLTPRPSAEWRAAVAMVTAAVTASQLTPPAGETARLAPEAVCRAAAACCYPPPARDVVSAGITHEDASVRTSSLELLVAILDQVCALQSRLAISPDYGPSVVASLGDHLLPHLPAFSALSGRWADIGDGEELLLVARALAGCHRVTERWQWDPHAISKMCKQLRKREMVEEDRERITDALQPLIAGAKSAPPVPGRLRPEDVPAILAEIRGRPLPSQTSPATGSASTGSATAGSATGGSEIGKDREHCAAASSHADEEEEVGELSGDSCGERLESYLAEMAPLLKTQEAALPALRRLGRQLTAALSAGGASGPAALTAGGASDPAVLGIDGASEPPPPPPIGWSGFVRKALKRSLREPAVGEAVLPHLTTLCQYGLFPCRGSASASAATAGAAGAAIVDTEISCELLYEMALGHSQFLERMLDPAEAELAARDALLRLLLQVATRCQHVCKSSHVALLLAAYGASLSETDQLILQLIGRYEMAGVSLHTYQPMVWGSAALNFYNPTQGGGLSLKRQPSANDVIDLLEADKMATTCRRLPLKMSLKLTPLPYDPAVYDARFLLSVLCQLTAPEQLCDPLRLVASGCLGLQLCLLSCRQQDVRKAAWMVMGRLYSQLQASRHQRLKQVWLTFLDLLRSAVPSDARLPFVVAHTWCRLVAVLQEPGHRLYQLVSRYLLKQAAQGALEVNRVPLFFELFNSADSLEHASHEAWMAGHLCQSIRQMSDYGVLQRTVTYKLVMGRAGSSLAGAAARPQLLKILEVTCQLAPALFDLTYRHDLLTWLWGVTRRFGHEHSTRAALVSLTAQAARTLAAHLAAGRGNTPRLVLEGLERVAERLERAAEGDPVQRARVERIKEQLRTMAVDG